MGEARQSLAHSLADALGVSSWAARSVSGETSTVIFFKALTGGDDQLFGAGGRSWSILSSLLGGDWGRIWGRRAAPRAGSKHVRCSQHFNADDTAVLIHMDGQTAGRIVGLVGSALREAQINSVGVLVIGDFDSVHFAPGGFQESHGHLGDLALRSG